VSKGLEATMGKIGTDGMGETEEATMVETTTGVILKLQ
jgi:hypothetical protein